MPDPITNEDLYGGSSQPPSPTVTPESPVPPVPPQIPVEETPEIPMPATEGTPAPAEPLKPEMPASPTEDAPPTPKASRGFPIIAIIIFIILFIAGIFLSSYIRPFITGVNSGSPKISTPTLSPTSPPTEEPTIIATTPTPADPFAGWQVSTIAGLSYKLPPGVTAPTCDGSACVSYGTYLPGGTRFTIAPKTVTQPLSNFRGALITDVNGMAFTSHDATVSGSTAIEFTGAFAGRTSGGYGFTHMHGIMIEVTPTETIEVNHFTPTGISTDWGRDDALFAQIISTVSFTSPPPIATTTPVPATTSGY
jgi:hypothetical protein